MNEKELTNTILEWMDMKHIGGEAEAGTLVSGYREHLAESLARHLLRVTPEVPEV